METLDCFKAYDVRGRVPDQLNEDIARRIGQAFADVVKPRRVVVGHDIRLSSEAIKGALVDGLMAQGVDVYDIGLCGTEEHGYTVMGPKNDQRNVGCLQTDYPIVTAAIGQLY